METYLPEEITEIILCHEDLYITEIVNFALTNKYYYAVIRNNNTLWKKKYFQIWPQLSKLFEKLDPDFSWYEEIKYVYNLKRKTREILYTMSLRFYKNYQLYGSDFSEWMQLYEETPRTYYYLIYDLKNIVDSLAAIKTIEVVPISTPGNKTLKYYAWKVLRYLLCSRLVDESHARLPLKLQTLENAIVFVTQWCRPNFDVSWEEIIPNKFDELAEKVKEHLKVIYPNHPLFAVPKEELEIWREEDIDGNKYDVENCNKIVQALESVLGITVGPIIITTLQGNDLLYELTDSDMVGVYGNYKSLMLTYQCVARRLGLKYEIIHSALSMRFVLRLTNNVSNAIEDMLPIARLKEFDPIEEIYQYRFLLPSLCPGLQLLELLEDLSPFKISSKTFMKEHYVDHTTYSSCLRNGINDPGAGKREIMKTLQEQTRWKETVNNSHKVRPPNLKYAVGMVMKHVTMPYKCLICDWDPVCFASVEWQRRNNIHSLKFKNKQPFYNILDEYGVHHYFAQECLKPRTYTYFSLFVEDIGRYFSHEFKTHFVPNEAKEMEYPEDAAVRRKFHQKLKAGNLL